ncbi:MAG TPA: chemotaxis protein CheB [Usitatibacter sp.]|nr:chemotaxis protein CheB [Usitatibacter sp.]
MRYDAVAIVASTRGLAPLRRLLERLPSDLPIPIFCLVQADASLAAQLREETGRDVRWASPGDAVEPGRIYLSPPGGTLLLAADRRMAIAPFGPESTALHPQDRFLETIAARYGSRALCIVLGGFEHDGVAGARAMKEEGGTVLVLDRATAAYWGMAEPIIRAGDCDRVLTAEEVAEALRAWFTPRDVIECAELQFELGSLLDSALRMSGTHMGHVQIYDPRSQALHIVVHRGFGKRALDGFGVVRVQDETACARALRYRHRIVIEDIEADAQFEPYRDSAAAGGFRAVQATPIFSDAHVAGVFSTHYPYSHSVGPHEGRMLDHIVLQAQPLVVRFSV